MSYMAQVIDGKLQQTSATQSAKSETGKNNGLDKEAFLQLLVAQMKYQDPLEPTSNTEYISQLATFSELEEMQNLVSNSDMQRANDLVGKTVTMKVTTSSGAETYEQGVVDYVTYEGSKTLLGINGSEYSLDDLLEVADTDYVEAYSMATAVVTAMNKLPAVVNLGLESKDAVDSITKVYDDMNDYQKSFLSKEQKDAIEAYRQKMDELVKKAEQQAANQTAGGGDAGDTADGETDENQEV
ncbi:MAG: flagellar hook capping protein [Lachnospiraceae bacterium]|nr:flagellar hook capping protein [Lachnospiraceae bacterium]